MSGTIVGKVDCKLTAITANGQQEFFKTIYDFMQQMVTAGHCTRIALQHGASGTGTDYFDGANPFGENAFGVWRFNGSPQFYLLLQWAFSASFGTTPGNPGALNGAAAQDGVGIAIASRDD